MLMLGKPSRFKKCRVACDTEKYNGKHDDCSKIVAYQKNRLSFVKTYRQHIYGYLVRRFNCGRFLLLSFFTTRYPPPSSLDDTNRLAINFIRLQALLQKPCSLLTIKVAHKYRRSLPVLQGLPVSLIFRSST